MSSHPAKPVNAYVPVRISARVRCGRVAAKTMAAGPPSLRPKMTAFPKPTASMTASISAARSSSVRTRRDRVRQPDPSLIEQEDATEPAELLHEGLEFGHGPKQLDVADERPGVDELDGPVAKHLIRQAQIAAWCVRRFRHGIERSDARRYDSQLWRNRVPLAPIAPRPRRAARDTRRPIGGAYTRGATRDGAQATAWTLAAIWPKAAIDRPSGIRGGA